MKKTLVIHGYCNNILLPFKKNFYEFGMLHGLYDLFKEKKLDLFKWGIKLKLNNIKFFNPFVYLKLYFDEKKLTHDENVLKELHEKIISNKYEIIIAHSMGTLLLFNYLEKYGINNSIKKVITIQSDLDFDIEIKNEESIKKLENNELIWENYFNFIDPQLIISSIINKKKRLGMGKSKSNLIKNNYHGLGWSINRHIYSVNNLGFINKLTN